MNELKVGDVVECIDDRPMLKMGWPQECALQKGSCYTVVATQEGEYPQYFGPYTALVLAEISNSPLGYKADRFKIAKSRHRVKMGRNVIS